LITIDESKCAACHLCELACSFHHLGAFSPRRSSLEVLKQDAVSEITITLHGSDDGIRRGCDGCPDNRIPLCVMWCPTDAVSLDLSKTGVPS